MTAAARAGLESGERSKTRERLVAAGMSPVAAAGKAQAFDRLAAVAGESAGSLRLFVPGRIEFLGKHTDYAGGRSLICAVDRGFCVVARPRTDAIVRITDVDRGNTAECAYSPDLKTVTGHWTNYPLTVVRRIARNFPDARAGADIAFSSDLPQAAGLSSSSALVVTTFLALSRVNDLPSHPAYRASIADIQDLSNYLGGIESGKGYKNLGGDFGVGTTGGSQDHTAILCAKPGSLVQYSFCPVRHEADVPLPAGYVFVVADSGVIAEKTGAAMEKYNRMSRAAGALVDLWNQQTGRADATMADAVHSSPDAPAELRNIIESSKDENFPRQVLRARLQQFLAESDRIIPAAAEALRRGDLPTLGKLVDESQSGAENALGNQVPETIFLPAEARRLGAAAASAFGAGMGGAVWALIPQDDANAFSQRWSDAYARQFPHRAPHARFLQVHAGPAALWL